jgi:hypothetical protein|tara:strand:- start:6012 stop:6491 length:480 start_codon:yes stop_codon:yes gene_type:complete
MKKLIVLSAIATLTSGAVLADDLSVTGAVPSVCEVSSIDAAASFPALAKDSFTEVPFTMQCNDVDGATVKLTSSEGHLQTVDGDDGTGIGYTAKLTAGPFGLTLVADSGVNDIFEEDSQSGTPAMAAGGMAGKILLTVTETPVYSGVYADMLMLSVTAN